MPQGYGSVYSASKSFSPVFTQALKQELLQNNCDKIDFLCVCPLAVQTPLTKQVEGYASITPRQCAQGSLKYLGRSTITNGHFIHNFQYWTTTLLPELIMLKIFAKESKKFYDDLVKRGKEDKKNS